MSVLEVSPETESKNYFEKYLQLIEKLRLENKDDGINNELGFLERILIALEAVLKDKVETLGNDKYKMILSEKVNEFIRNWYNVFEFSTETLNHLASTNYNFILALNALSSLDARNFDSSLKYIIKINPVAKIDNKLNSFREITERKNDTTTRSAAMRLFEMKTSLAKFEKMTFNNVFEELNKTFEVIENNFVTNLFNINYESIRYYTIDELIENIRKLNFTEGFESFFRIVEGKEYFVWDINFHWKNQEEYSANKLSYLIWSFSNALESIETVDVSIQDWGSGSKWVNLKVKIKSEVAKIDALDFLKRLRQLGQSIHGKSSLEAVEKTGAETDKIKVETEILKKEYERKEKMANLTEEMIIYEKALDIEKKESENEKLRLENLEKKLSIMEKVSRLAMDGLIKQDGDFQMHINECLFLSNNGGGLTVNEIDNIGEIEGKEEKKQISDEGNDINV